MNVNKVDNIEFDVTLNNAQTIVALASMAGEIKTIGGTPFAFVPPGYKFQSLEECEEFPLRSRGTIETMDLPSFIAAVIRRKRQGTTIYGRQAPPRLVAVIDDDHGDVPGWRQYRVSYDFALSAEYLEWAKKSTKPMDQQAFAQFIEDNLPDIVEPSASDMLEISRSLEAKKRVNFASSVRLPNGATEFTYEETIQGTAAKGKLQVPETFAIGIPVLHGGAIWRIDARLRYRIQDGKLMIWYELIRVHKIMETVLSEAWAAVAKETGLTPLHAEPAPPFFVDRE